MVISWLVDAMRKGITTFLLMAMPVVAIAYASPQPEAAARGFGADKYFSMMAGASQFNNNWLGGVINDLSTNPVEVVKAKAADYGFDVQHDEFFLVVETNKTAVVRVRHNAETADIYLERQAKNHWLIASVK